MTNRSGFIRISVSRVNNSLDFNDGFREKDRIRQVRMIPSAFIGMKVN